MKKVGVKVSAKAPAKLKGTALILPVSGGKADPTIAKAEVEHEGSIVLQAGNRKVPLRSIELKAKKTPLFAKVGGSQLKVADSKRLSSQQRGFAALHGKGLALTQKVATRLNKKLRTPSFFHEGHSIGSSRSSRPAPTGDDPASGPGNPHPRPQHPGKAERALRLAEPDLSRRTSPARSSSSRSRGKPDRSRCLEGTLRLGGAIELLQLGAGQVFHKEYWLDLGAKSTLSSKWTSSLPLPFPGKLGRIGTMHRCRPGFLRPEEPHDLVFRGP